MNYPPDEARFFELCQARNQPVPDGFMAKPPLLTDEQADFYSAFWLLSSSRQTGFGIGYIPLTEIESYCRMFDVRDVPMFVEIMRHLDGLYVDFKGKKFDAESKVKKGN